MGPGFSQPIKALKLNIESRIYGNCTHINKFVYYPNYISSSLI